LDKPCRRGERGRPVQQVQEWLTLHESAGNIEIDGDFGPMTEAALKRFQARAGLPVTGVADAATFAALVAPMKAALAPIAPRGRSLGELTAAYAQQHLRQRPREVGGANKGPWVRLYMDGHDGPEFLWCAGFATWCLRAAAEALKVPMPLPRTFSCDVLGVAARKQGRLLVEPLTPEQCRRITPGSLFLVRKTASDWIHTGIIVSATERELLTIEGNSNDEGGREGHEVCLRSRGYSRLDIAPCDSPPAVQEFHGTLM
jgi:hypothetical protein